MAGPTYDLVLSNCHTDSRELVNIGILGGKIKCIETTRQLVGKESIDINDALVLPSLTDGHAHLDKTFVGLDWRPHIPGTSIQDRVEIEREMRRKDADGTLARAKILIEQIVTLGTGCIRSHLDIDDETNIESLEKILELRSQYNRLIDIQFVAFPQSGLVSNKATQVNMVRSLQAGVDVVGGLDPAGFDNDIEGHLDIVFGLAERFGKPIDIHLHDQNELGVQQLRCIAERTIALGMQSLVTVSHAYALGAIQPAVFADITEILAEAGVAIFTDGAGANPIPPVRYLQSAGINIFAGSDNIRDAWSPYGTGDMLDRARLIGIRSGLVSDDDLRMAFALVTYNARRALGKKPSELRIGDPADLMVVDAQHIPEVIVSNPLRKLVLKAGQVIARNGQLISK
jgi:cytosine deaminase